MAKARYGQLDAKVNKGRMLRAGALLSAAIALAGCDENGKFNLLKPKAGAGAGAQDGVQSGGGTGAVRSVEKDVEAPEIFHVKEKGLWDGRPSLGGVWVAHPSVKEPRRVMIRNTANGKSVIGALFRREMANPGPKLQVSSDAAEALGLIAGQPTVLDVVALKRVEVPLEPPAPEPDQEAGTGAGTGAEAGEISAKPLDDPIASAAAAIDEASGKSGGKTGTKPAPRPDITAAAEAAGVSTPGGTARPAPASDQGQKPASALSKPFIQIGIFSVEQNARNTATSLKTAGLTPVVKRHESQGKIFWRVLVGPAASKADLARMLKEAKALGFTDAYPVRN